MANENINIEIYKKLICDMICDIRDIRFLRQIYSYIYREHRRTSQVALELHVLIDKMQPEDVRLLYTAALELQKQ